ncbi:MAG TPA: DUF951 domain-containing protein [Candidatus Onthousia faecipullorum]|uniref:DUF951 domain-containing protein n=1 Tax=Candidatus Onthousia faecipullorum TaxID=2840887 RepID=A0A9D1KBH4_9FIRM|nr:DUF951 domain-containing protein [Candidatus Onthousia faecipullorum]
MESKNYKLGDRLVLKKGHPCGTNDWEIVKLGADIKLKCTGCGRLVFIPRIELNKKIKKIIEKESQDA